MKVKFYFYYAEVSIKGNASQVVYGCSGTAKSEQKPDELFDCIMSEVVKEAAKTVKIPENELLTIIKRFNTL